MEEDISKSLKTFSFWLFLMVLFTVGFFITFLLFTSEPMIWFKIADYPYADDYLINFEPKFNQFLGAVAAWVISIPITILRATNKISTVATLLWAIVLIVIIPLVIYIGFWPEP